MTEPRITLTGPGGEYTMPHNVDTATFAEAAARAASAGPRGFDGSDEATERRDYLLQLIGAELGRWGEVGDEPERLLDEFAAAVRADAASRIYDYKMAYRERLGDDVVDGDDWHGRFLYGLFCAQELTLRSAASVATHRRSSDGVG